MVKNKNTILCFSEYYLPAFKAGGPIKSINNFVDYLGDEFNIKIICRAKDLKEKKYFSNIKINSWNSVGKAKVFYISDKMIKNFGIFTLLKNTKYDVLYINSFFSFSFSIFPLILRKFKLTVKKPCVISPRGELSQNALKYKNIKKLLFISFAKVLGLHENLHWKASNKSELNDIKTVNIKDLKFKYILPDLISKPPKQTKKPSNRNYRKTKQFKIIFLSRISPIKNLDFLLRVLAKVSSEIKFSIIGIREDLIYWQKCFELCKKLPINIELCIENEVLPFQVSQKFQRNDLFTFPTRGENFGHVIFESLSVGTPVLVSDKTLWKSDKLKGVEVATLDEYRWVKTIEKLSNLSFKDQFKRRKGALLYANKVLKINDKSKLAYKKLFYDILFK